MNHCEGKDRQKRTGGQLKPPQEIAVQYKLNQIKGMSGYVQSFQKCISTPEGKWYIWHGIWYLPGDANKGTARSKGNSSSVTGPQDAQSKNRDLFCVALFTNQDSSNYRLRTEKILVRSCTTKFTVPDMEPQSASPKTTERKLSFWNQHRRHTHRCAASHGLQDEGPNQPSLKAQKPWIQQCCAALECWKTAAAFFLFFSWNTVLGKAPWQQ